MGFLTNVRASLSRSTHVFLEGVLGGHHSKCIRLTPSFLIYPAPRRGLSYQDVQSDVGSSTEGWKAMCTHITGWTASHVSSTETHYAARLHSNICLVLSYMLWTLCDGTGSPVWPWPAASYIKCAALQEIILISRGLLNLQVEAE